MKESIQKTKQLARTVQESGRNQRVRFVDNRTHSIFHNNYICQLKKNSKSPTIQRIQDLSAEEWTSQATHLSAELQNPANTIDLGKFHSGGGAHAEDNLVAHLQANIGAIPPGNYQLLIMINRSPCTNMGTCNKAVGVDGCIEKLIALQNNGLGGPPATHTFAIVLHYRHLYGHSSDEHAISALAIEEAARVGLMMAGDPGYYDVGAAKALSTTFR